MVESLTTAIEHWYKYNPETVEELEAAFDKYDELQKQIDTLKGEQEKLPHYYSKR